MLAVNSRVKTPTSRLPRASDQAATGSQAKSCHSMLSWYHWKTNYRWSSTLLHSAALSSAHIASFPGKRRSRPPSVSSLSGYFLSCPVTETMKNKSRLPRRRLPFQLAAAAVAAGWHARVFWWFSSGGIPYPAPLLVSASSTIQRQHQSYYHDISTAPNANKRSSFSTSASPVTVLENIQELVSQLQKQPIQSQEAIFASTGDSSSQQPGIQQLLDIAQQICNDYVRIDAIPRVATKQGAEMGTDIRSQIILWLASHSNDLQEDMDKTHDSSHCTNSTAIPRYQVLLDLVLSSYFTSRQDEIVHALTLLVQLRHDVHQVSRTRATANADTKPSHENEQNPSFDSALEEFQIYLKHLLARRELGFVVVESNTASVNSKASSFSSPFGHLLHVHRITADDRTPYPLLEEVAVTDQVHPIGSVDELIQTRLRDEYYNKSIEEGQNKIDGGHHRMLRLQRRVFCLMHSHIPLLRQEKHPNGNEGDPYCEPSTTYSQQIHKEGLAAQQQQVDASSLLLEPLVVVYIALTGGTTEGATHSQGYGGCDDISTIIPSRMAQLFPNDDQFDKALPPPVPSPAVATLYSISNTQPGLAGLGMGKVLLHQVIQVNTHGAKTPACSRRSPVMTLALQ